MPYTKTTWVDEVPTGTPKYAIVGDVEGAITAGATIELVTPVTPGTPINASNLNKHEDAIELAVATAEDAQATADDVYAIHKSQAVQAQIVYEASQVTTDIFYFYVPSSMDGMNLIRATAFVATAGTTGSTTVQVRNMTKYSGNDALSTAISIASGSVSGTPGTVNTSYDDVSTDEKIKIYVTGTSTIKPKGLWVVLEFEKP